MYIKEIRLVTIQYNHCGNRIYVNYIEVALATIWGVPKK